MDQKSSDYELQELEKFPSTSKLSYEAFGPGEERSADQQRKSGDTTECQTQKSDASINQPMKASLPIGPRNEVNKVSKEDKEEIYESPALLILPIMLPVTPLGVATGTSINPTSEMLLQNQRTLSSTPVTSGSMPNQAMVVPVEKTEQGPPNQFGPTGAAMQTQPIPYPTSVAGSSQLPANMNVPQRVETSATTEEQRGPIEQAAPTEQLNVQSNVIAQSCTPALQTSQPQMIVATPSSQPVPGEATCFKVPAKMAPKPSEVANTMQAATTANAARPAVNLSSTPQQVQETQKAEAQRVAQKCVSNPILTPVTDDVPTEDRGGDWAAPETTEEKQQIKNKTVPSPHKATIPAHPVTFPQKESDIQETGKVKQAPKGSKKCLSNPILTPISDEFPTENWDGEWIVPKEIILEKSLPMRVTKSATPKEVGRAPAVSKTAQVIKTPETTHGLKLTEKSLTPIEKIPKKEKPSQVWRGEKTIGPPENIGKIVAKCVSDPVVTPVTDEFPSENTEGQWIAPNFLKATKQRLFVQRTDHADKISHKRIISNPIVTPCTDEYPSEGDISELQNDRIEEKQKAKPEQAVNIQRSPVVSINNATHKDNRGLTERWMKDQMDLIVSLSGSQSNILSTKEDEASRKEEKVDLTVTATDKTENYNVSSPRTPFGSNEFAASREHILHRKEKAWAKRSNRHEKQEKHRASAGKRDKKKNVFGTVTKFIKAVSKRARHKRSADEN